MRLLKVDEDGNVNYDNNILGFEAFLNLWQRDKTTNKEEAIKEIAFVYFITSMNSDNQFREYGSTERIEVVSKIIFGKQVDYSKDEVISRAIETMLELDKSFAKDFLRSTIGRVDKLKSHLDDIDLDERDNNGKLIHNAKQYHDILVKQIDLIKSLKEAVKMVDSEDVSEDGKIRGDARRELDI